MPYSQRSELAPVQGDYTDDRPAERQPGTKEHLGDEDLPYAGAPDDTDEKPAKKSSSKSSSSGS